MGEVYRARDTKLKRDVAIKILPDEFSLDPERVGRFQREAEILASFNHPNIAAIYDFREQNSLRFLVLELVEGDTLAERIAKGPLSIDEVLSIAIDICVAIGAAHEKGVIHRDLKPGNVKITPDGKVKVLDFGLATAPRTETIPSDLSTTATALGTSMGLILGTVSYMSPEQATGAAMDGRSDIFSLGIMLFEMLSGHRPFEGANDVARMHAIVHRPIPALKRPDLAAPLRMAVEKALEKDPAERYQSVRELGGDLRRVSRKSEEPVAEVRPPRLSNLPIQATSFVGRAKETAEVQQLLDTTRLLTLTGVGGTGKTRLAMQVAAHCLERFRHGVWFVELAPLADPSLVPQTVAVVLGVREAQGRLALSALADYLEKKNLLLILDNCEHLVEASASFADAVLHTCPDVRILATSREALGITGETAWPVLSMQTPNPAAKLSAVQIEEFEAVQLFIDRARSVRPDFQLTDDNAYAVAQICQRLDGIPLALELAAARVKMFSIEQIAARLDDRFRLLTGGSRTALPRQQTLRSLIDWSYSLLSEPERVLLRRLSVFAGGWTYEGAESVCMGEGIDAGAVLDLLSRLVDKSLVIVAEHHGQVRYHLLETIRQYSREKLMDSGEGERERRQHLAFYVNMTAAAEMELRTRGQVAWLDRLEAELDNLRAALDWAMGARAVESALRLLGASYLFWWQHERSREVRQRLEEFLALPEAAERTIGRAKALLACGVLEGWVHGNFEEMQPLLTEAVDLAFELGDNRVAVWAQLFLATAAQRRGDYETARELFDKSKALALKVNDRQTLGQVLLHEADTPFLQENYPEAKKLLEVSIAHHKTLSDNIALSYCLRRFGQSHLHTGDPDKAEACIRESMALNWRLGDKQGVAACLAALAAVARARQHESAAVTLLGAADATLKSIRSQLLFIDQYAYDHDVGFLRAHLAPAAFDAAWKEGQDLTIDLAMSRST